MHALFWWASRYAWNEADGLPTRESQQGLIEVALTGKRDPRWWEKGNNE